jgi:hypothetical protein
MGKSHHALNLIADNISLIALLVILVAGLAYFEAMKLGGESKPKLKFIFTLTGAIGLGIVALYSSSKL